MQYRRSKTKGATYFFTLVTHNRRQILCQPENVDLLRGAFRYVMQKHPFKIDAIVILPDHLHCIWTLPEGDADFSTRWRLIKSYLAVNVTLNIKAKSQLLDKVKRKKRFGNVDFGSIKFGMNEILLVM